MRKWWLMMPVAVLCLTPYLLADSIRITGNTYGNGSLSAVSSGFSTGAINNTTASDNAARLLTQMFSPAGSLYSPNASQAVREFGPSAISVHGTDGLWSGRTPFRPSRGNAPSIAVPETTSSVVILGFDLLALVVGALIFRRYTVQTSV
jgi:hypothetical protein